MRSAWWAAAAIALAACPKKSEPAAKHDAAKQVVAAIDAGVTIDAAPPAPKPVDLATLPVFPGAAPDGPVIIHAADADLGALQHLLARGTNHVAVVPAKQQVTGTIGPTTGAAALAALGGTITPLPKGKGEELDLDFYQADPRVLLRLIASLERDNVVLGVDGELPQLDVWTRRGRSGAVLAGIAAALGLEADEAGGLTWLRRPDGPQLDRKLLATRGPKAVDLDVVEARAGAIYALLAELGAGAGGAPCDAGPPITLTLRQAATGTVIAAVASLSGIAPRADASCASTVTVTGADPDLALRAIARAGSARAAIVEQAGAIGVVKPGGAVQEIGVGWLRTDGGVSVPFPAPAPTSAGSSGSSPLQLLEHGRLAATVIDGARSAAVIESDGFVGVVEAIAKGRARPRSDLVEVRIEPGKVIYVANDGDPERVVVLSAR